MKILRNSPYYLWFYFTALLLLAPANLLSFDTYYYWDWSRHLALSYYDGSPMIAWLIKLSTGLFGNTLFALGFAGIALVALTGRIIYKTARLFLLKESSYIALFLWLFSPLVTMNLLRTTTCDSPLTLFWALTLYYAAKYIQFRKTSDIYLIGLSIGLMLLSKYTGVVLILALVLFLLKTRYRDLFQSRHLYFASLIALMTFSPVLIWNYQHAWQSFIYQLTTHQLHVAVNPLIKTIKTVFITFIPVLNFMLIPPLICWLKRVDTEAWIVRLCRMVCTTFLCFYVILASKTAIRESWLAPYLISSALLGGFCFQTFHYRKSLLTLLILYLIISAGILLDNQSGLNFIPSKKLTYYHLIQQLNADYPHLPKTILTSGWMDARMLFFLKNKPEIRTLDCGIAQNQYAEWSADTQQKIRNKIQKKSIFIDYTDRSNCLKKYFDRCDLLPTRVYPYRGKMVPVFAYNCLNH